MGVDRQQLSGQSASTPVRESSAKRVKAVPSVGIYRPPALRRSEEQYAPVRPISPVTDVKPERTRPARQRRPDIQVYVPRAKRLSSGTSSSQETNSSYLKTRGRKQQKDTTAATIQKSRSAVARGCNDNSVPNTIDDSTGSVAPKQYAHSPQYGLIEETGDSSREETVQSSFSLSPSFGLDASASSNCTSDILGSATSQLVEANNFPHSFNNENRLEAVKDVTMLTDLNRSQSVEFAENFLDEVGVDQSLALRGSRSSSAASTSANSGRNTPDKGGQLWDYFSEIKNATNSSSNKSKACEMDVENEPSTSDTEESNVSFEHPDKSKRLEASETLVTGCDSDQCLDGSVVAVDEGDLNYNEGCAHGDTETVNSSDGEMCKLVEEKLQEDILSDECRGHKKDEDDDECRVQEVQNRKNRRIIRNNFVSDVLIISDPDPVSPSLPQNDAETEKSSPPNGVLTKKKKVRHKAVSSKVESSEKQPHSSNPVAVTLNPDECTWEMMFDDNGECLDPKLMDELTSAVGSVAIEKPLSDYRSYQSRVELIMSGAADDEFSHVLEIYNFPAEFKTHDLYAVFSPYMKGGFEIKWVDDTHALGVFSSPNVAAEVLATTHPFVKTRPLQQATHESRMKARRSAEFLQPYRPRPETCAALARRLVTGALGVKLTTTPEEREAERKMLKEAREKKRLAARQRDEAWEGTLGEK